MVVSEDIVNDWLQKCQFRFIFLLFANESENILIVCYHLCTYINKSIGRLIQCVYDTAIYGMHLIFSIESLILQ